MDLLSLVDVAPKNGVLHSASSRSVGISLSHDFLPEVKYLNASGGVFRLVLETHPKRVEPPQAASSFFNHTINQLTSALWYSHVESLTFSRWLINLISPDPQLCQVRYRAVIQHHKSTVESEVSFSCDSLIPQVFLTNLHRGRPENYAPSDQQVAQLVTPADIAPGATVITTMLT